MVSIVMDMKVGGREVEVQYHTLFQTQNKREVLESEAFPRAPFLSLLLKIINYEILRKLW